MKITIVLSHADFSGGVRVVSIYADRLKKRGHEVVVVSRPYYRPNLLDQLKSFAEGRGFLPLPDNPASYLDALDVEHKIISEYRPIMEADVPDADVIVATWWETAEWVAGFSPSKGAKVYFVQHHETFEYLPQRRVEATYSLPFFKITIAKWLQDLMRNRYSDQDVALVPNSVDTKQFYAPQRKKQDLPTVGLVYSTAYWKGCDISLKAFELATQRGLDIQLVLFGHHLATQELPLSSKVRFFQSPLQNEIRNLYASCDAWLFASRSEGFGLPILEAMACRTPVIGTPVGAAPELLADGAGILVDAEAPDAMAEAIKYICSLSNEEWQQMSNAAYAKAIGYTWDDATELFEKALYRAISRQEGDDPQISSYLSSTN